MKNNGRTQGSKEWAKPIVVYPDAVYVHKNIIELEDGMYEYDEISYDIEEYIALLQEEITSTQMALVEIYEGGLP